ncbi:MAG: alkylhalidase [Opitutae bacterium]|nr:alkylhalidase [Opitutae bacterium]|tara:strand:+ start:20001 stop:21269 length:1269 start_codon:yes stop_codon:yes gene_type:complete
MISLKTNYDAIVVGGGPAGSTTGALLAEKGHDVLIVEKEKFPRYHVGESLMPFCYFPLERLGLIDKLMDSGNPRKYCVQFVRQDGFLSQPFYFFQHFDHPSSTTWQVWRSEFDKMILDKARLNGATVWEETKAKALLKEDERVKGIRVESSEFGSQELFAPIVVDASGRDCFASIREKWKIRDPKLKKIALWTYYKGAKRDPGLDEGATTVAYLPNKGWFWYIPLSGDMVSVGIVAEKDYLFDGSTKDHDEIFQREIQNNEWIKDHLSGAEQTGEYRITGEYSYRNRYCSTDGLVLAGDALGFLDPVFSSGVFLALKSGVMLADEIDSVMESGNPLTSTSFDHYGKRMQSSIEIMRKIVYAFYDDEFSFGSLVKRGEHLRASLTDCLIGNVDDQDFKELFDAMSDLADLPEPVEHGLARASK